MNHCNVVVIGGGQAGLAVGHHLASDGRDFTVLDAGAIARRSTVERTLSVR